MLSASGGGALSVGAKVIWVSARRPQLSRLFPHEVRDELGHSWQHEWQAFIEQQVVLGVEDDELFARSGDAG